MSKMYLILIIIHAYFNLGFIILSLFFDRYLTVLQSRCVQHILNNLDEMAVMTMLKRIICIFLTFLQ